MKVTQASGNRIMSKVMGLLNLANDPNASEHERKLAAEHAERLMMQHQIDRMDLKPEEKAKVISDYWDLKVGEASNQGSYEFASQLGRLMATVLTHCGARVNEQWTYATDDDGKKVYDTRRYRVVGYPEDIGYAERIWFNVFKEFVSNINPKWSNTEPIEINAYNLAKASIEWQEMVTMANKAGDERIPVSELDRWGRHIKGNRPLIRGIKMLRDGYKAECDRRSEPYEYNIGKRTRGAYRNSFASSFASTIRQRLTDLRKQKETGENVVDANKFALAVIDTKQQVDAEFYRLFPEFDPEVRRKMAEAEAAEAQKEWDKLPEAEKVRIRREQAKNEARWARQSARARSNYGRVRENPYENVEMSAWNAGRKAAKNVNLRDDAQVKKQDRKGISE